MRNYSTENDARQKAAICIALLSVALAMLFYTPTNQIIDVFTNAFPNLLWLKHIGLLAALEPFVLYGVIWMAFDWFLWKIPGLEKWHKIPNLNGTWNGELKSTYKNENGEQVVKPMTMVIHQTFFKISIRCEFPESSESYANVVGIVDYDGENGKCRLEFSYKNRAIDDSVTFESGRDIDHWGYNVLRIDGDMASGDYVARRNEITSGHIKLERAK